MSENQNQHAPCPFCGGDYQRPVAAPMRENTKAWIMCFNHECFTRGPQREAGSEAEAVAAAWEAWDDAGKREDAALRIE